MRRIAENAHSKESIRQREVLEPDLYMVHTVLLESNHLKLRFHSLRKGERIFCIKSTEAKAEYQEMYFVLIIFCGG